MEEKVVHAGLWDDVFWNHTMNLPLPSCVIGSLF